MPEEPFGVFGGGRNFIHRHMGDTQMATNITVKALCGMIVVTIIIGYVLPFVDLSLVA